MANPMYGQNKNDDFQNKLFIVVNGEVLSAANQLYVYIPFKCTIKEVNYAVTTELATAKSTITMKTAAGTMTGTFEIAHEAVVGTTGTFTPVDNNTVEAGATLEIENDAAPTAGQACWTIVCDKVID